MERIEITSKSRPTLKISSTPRLASFSFETIASRNESEYSKSILKQVDVTVHRLRPRILMSQKNLFKDFANDIDRKSVA